VRRAAADEEVELTDAEVDDVRGLVQAYLDSPVRRRVAAAPWTGRERAFAFALGEHEPLVNGVLDLVAREADGGWLVVDYKTDAVAPDDDLEGEVERRYGVQRRIYALAALHAGAPRVEVVHLYLARPDAPVTATYGAQDRPALEADLREVASGLLGGHFAPAPDPHRGLCLTCPGRRALCSHEEPATLRPPPPPGPSGRRSAGPSAAG
jgi:ATP-dependent helicase/nuclease subunit A